MTSEQIAIALLTFIGGACVLGSYVPIVLNAKNFDYWFGTPKNLQNVFYFFWAIAAVGFLIYTMSSVFDPAFSTVDKVGLLSYWKPLKPVLIALVLLGSVGWSVGVYAFSKNTTLGSKIATSASLVIVALSTILLLAGEVERSTPWYATAGLLSFAITPVLIDAIGWNSKFILSTK